jgi:hypothetical protein
MMKKLLILNLGNDGYRHRYALKKEEAMKGPLVKLLNALKLENEAEYLFYNEARESEKDVRISEYKDLDRHLQNKEFNVDLFFGTKKVILVVRTKKRTKLIAAMEKYAEFEEIKVSKGMKNKKTYKHLVKTVNKKK